jgi:hypothetical protein
LDIIITPDGDARWKLTDLLGRSMGHIEKSLDDRFTIHPAGQAVATMAGLQHGLHPSLDVALAAIETHTRGVCRHSSGEEEAD